MQYRGIRRSSVALARGGVLCLALGLMLTVAGRASAKEIGFALSGAIDQPRVNATVQIQPVAGVAGTGDPLVQDVGGLATALELLNLDPAAFGLIPTNIQAYYDTGADVGLISHTTSTSMGIPTQTGATFTDVGVGGSETFGISGRLTIKLADTAPGIDLTDLSNYKSTFIDRYVSLGQPAGRTPLGQEAQNPVDQLISNILGSFYEFDVLGMPYFDHKVVVMDARSLNDYVLHGQTLDLDNLTSLPQLYTHVYEKGDPNNPAWNPANAADPGIPTAGAVNLTIPLKFANFGGLTTTSAGATAPSLAHNPMVGGDLPDHLSEDDGRDDAPGITITRDTAGGTLSSEGTWLFDTGAAASMISYEQAAALGIHYKAGFEPGNAENNPVQLETSDGDSVEQFTLELLGVGGPTTVAGFYLDSMTIAALEDDLTFTHAPVLVANIAVDDSDSLGGQYILDGVLGMNFLLPSADIDGGIDPLNPGSFALAPGAFDFITYDETTNTLMLTYSVPEPTTLALVLFAGLPLLRRKRRRRAGLAQAL